MSTNAMARSTCWPESICSLGKSMPWSETATAAASSSSFSMPLSGQQCDQVDSRQSFRAHLQRNQNLARHATGRPLRVHLHAKHGSWLNLIEGFFSKFARSVLRHIRVASKQELKERIMA